MPEPDVTGGMGAPSSAGSTSNTVTVLGTNQLQSAIDKFESTVTKLEALYAKVSNGGTGLGSNTGKAGNAGGATAGQPGTGSFTSTYRDAFAAFGGGYGGKGAGGPGGPQQTQNGSNPNSWNNGQQGQGFRPQLQNAFSGNGNLSTGQKIGMGAGAMLGMAANYGNSQMDTQVGISSYTRSQAVFGMSNYTARNLAYGSHGNNLNMLAQSPEDAAAGQTMINAIGNYAPSSARFRTAQSGAGQIGIANPGMSYAQDASYMAMMTNPQTSYMLNMMGIRNTMTTRRGGSNSLATMNSALMQRLTNQSSMSQSAFNAKIGGLNSSGNIALSGIFGQQNAQEMIAGMSVQNRLAQGMNGQKKLSDAQITTLMNQASKGQSGALKTLGAYGVPTSDIQMLQKTQAAKTSTQGDISQSFTQGLSLATQALTEFEKLINKIVDIPGVNQAFGTSTGFFGTLNKLGDPLASLPGLGGLATLFDGGGSGPGSPGGGHSTPVGQGGNGVNPQTIPDYITGAGGASRVANDFAATVVALLSIPTVVSAIDKFGTGTRPKTTTAKPKVKPKTNNPGVVKGLGKDATEAAGAGLGAAAGAAIPVLGETGLGEVAGAMAGRAAGGWIADTLGFATGGTLPGYTPGRDPYTIKVSGGEGILVPEAVRGMGGERTINAINKKYAGHRGAGKHPQRPGKRYADGGVIANDAKKYEGHRYIYGGPSNPQGGWDCSSFVDYVVGHDENMGIPGGTWAKTTNSGKSHGPATGAWENWSGTSKISSDPAKAQAGDIVLWSTHIGIATGSNAMVSALDTAQGTLATPISGYGPSGEQVEIRRLTGVAGGGSSNGSSGSTSTSIAAGGLAGGGLTAPSSTSEAENVAAALGGGAAGGGPGTATSSSGSSSSSSSGSSGSAAVGAGSPASGNLIANASAIGAYLKTAGLNKYAVAGVMGNMLQESGGDWNAPGGGLIQIIADAQPNSLAESLSQTVTYIKQNAGGIRALNSKSTSVKAATDVFMSEWERPAPATENEARRLAGAEAAYAAGYANGGVVPGCTPVQKFATGGVAYGNFTAALDAPGASAHSAGCGATINLEFNSGAITIGTGQQGSSSKFDASHSARELISEIKKQLQSEDLYAAIAKGDH